MSSNKVEFQINYDSRKGSVLKQLEEAINIVIDNLLDIDVYLIRDGLDYSKATGDELERIGQFLGVYRKTGETDTKFRRRIQLRISSRTPVTVDAIQDMFENLTGLRPVISEDFQTRVYTSGQTKPPNESIAEFLIQFDVGITEVNEQNLVINSDGITLTVGHTTNIDDTGTIGAWLESDPTHQTDLSISIDANTSKILVSGGPYVPNTKFDVKYDITPLDDYDTISELSADIDLFSELLQLVKGAGIKTSDILLTKFMDAWFQDGGSQVFTVSDLMRAIVNLISIETIPNILTFSGFDYQTFDTNGFDKTLTPIVADYFNYTLTSVP